VIIIHAGTRYKLELLATIQIPLHVTGIWLPVLHSDPLLSGSLGAGLLLDPPATVKVYSCKGQSSSCGIAIRSENQLLGGNLDVIEEIKRFRSNLLRQDLLVEVDLPVALGKGYACSAIAALGVAIGYGLRAGLTLEESSRIAHIAEVKAGTGLGDVVALLYGRGLEIRYSPGGPGFARVENIPIHTTIITATLEGFMHTQQMHSKLGEELYSIAAPRLASIFKKPSFDVFIREARHFSIRAGFVSDELRVFLDNLLETGLIKGWYVKKRVLVVAPRSGRRVEEVVNLLAKKGLRPRVHETSSSPLRVQLYM
jgi:pantoate kinase